MVIFRCFAAQTYSKIDNLYKLIAILGSIRYDEFYEFSKAAFFNSNLVNIANSAALPIIAKANP